MDLNELASRVQMMEDNNAQQAAQAEQRAFIDKYGTRFSGDEGIGMAILAEMNRRNVPSAAVGADRVVNEILDAIRQEATQILDKIKGEAAAVTDLMNQVQDIQDSVSAATGAPGGDGQLDLAAQPPIPPPPDAGAPPMDGGIGAPPDAGPSELAAPPMGPPAMPPPGEPAGGPAPNEPPVPPEAPSAPIPIGSDARIKRFTVTKRQPTGWKPPAHLITAIGSKV